MLDRRAFMQGAALMAAFTLAAARASALPLHKVIVDTDVPQSRLFGAAAQNLGAAVHAIAGDVTDFWHEGLVDRGHDTAIAGMTRFHSFFAIDMLAADAGLRVIYRGHHHVASNGTTSHDLFGPKDAIRHIKFDGSKAGWSRSLATILTSWPADHRAIAKAHSTISEAHARGISGGALVSWLIAPPLL
jgi:hypothetical protein